MARHLRLLGRDLIPRAPVTFGAAVLAAALVTFACDSDSSHPSFAGASAGNGGESGATGTGAVSSRGGRRGNAGNNGNAGNATDGDGAPGAGASGNPGRDGGSSDLDGAAGVSGSGGRNGRDGGGTGGDGTGGAPPIPDGGFTSIARCRSEALEAEPWMDYGRHDPADPSFARFGAISADELSVVWTSSSGDVYLAERPVSPGLFGAPAKLSDVPLAVDRAGMSPTGLVVMAVAKDRTTFVEFRRDDRKKAFKRVDADDLGGLRLIFEGGGLVSEPVLGGDKESLFFLVTRGDSAPQLYESRFSPADNAWGEPAGFTNAELESKDADHRRRPTGGSSDGLTLFFYDEVNDVERAGFRVTPTSPFALFLDMGAFPDAVPNDSCDTLYFTGEDGSGAGLFLAH